MILQLIVLSLLSFSLGENKYIYIMRHGEKIKDKTMGLSQFGQQHITCLADHYYWKFPYGAPDHGIAKLSHTERSMESLGIIANKLNISTSNCAKKQKIYDVVNKVFDKLEHHNIILLVWENNEIPVLATALGCRQCHGWNYDPMSFHHDPHLFNVTWVLKYPAKRSYTTDKKYPTELEVFDQNFFDDECQTQFNYTSRKFN